MIKKIEGGCAYKGCDQPATEIAADTYGLVAVFCADHWVPTLLSCEPEYIHRCPNCGCRVAVP